MNDRDLPPEPDAFLRNVVVGIVAVLLGLTVLLWVAGFVV